MVNIDKCEFCNNTLVTPLGKKTSDIILIGHEPSWQEVRNFTPFSDDGGNLLRQELAKLGEDMYQIRRTYLWLHEADSKKPKCKDKFAEMVITEARGRKAVLLLGSEVTEFFTGYGVMEVSGLQVKSQYLSNPLIVACPSPRAALRGTIGELRLALTRFIRAYRDL